MKKVPRKQATKQLMKTNNNQKYIDVSIMLENYRIYNFSIVI